MIIIVVLLGSTGLDDVSACCEVIVVAGAREGM